tara:strand:+ start:311 stop:784 length:474 start_codon:yes stop_codon:yes gene_type:complete
LKNNLQIRKASLSDVDLLFRWTNDELVRAQSFSSTVIPYADHCTWFQRKVEDENSFFFIIEQEDREVGLVRFDINDGAATIGVSVDKEFRGKGLGAEIINLGVLSYFKENDFPILASIKKVNMASVKSFKKAGFQYFKDELLGGVDSVVYQLKKNHE